MATNAGALWEGLEALCALLETVPPADDLVGYRLQSPDFPRLLALEKKVSQIRRRLGDELMRYYRRAPVLLGGVIDFQLLLKAGVVPFWLIDFCCLPDYLVRLTHVSRRFVGVLENGDLWGQICVRAI